MGKPKTLDREALSEIFLHLLEDHSITPPWVVIAHTRLRVHIKREGGRGRREEQRAEKSGVTNAIS